MQTQKLKAHWLWAIFLMPALLGVSCQFKKKNFVEESKEQIDEIAKEQARQKDLQAKSFLTKSEVTVAFKEEKAPHKYIGVLRLPERVTHVAYIIETAPQLVNEDPNTEAKWAPYISEQNEKTNLITFPAKSGQHYRVTVSSVSELGAGAPLVFKMSSPLDLEIRPGEELVIDSSALQGDFLTLGRLFLNEKSKIKVLVPGFKIVAKKIIAKHSSLITTFDPTSTIETRVSLFRNPPNIELDLGEVIGTLRVEMKGVDGHRGIDGKDTAEYLALLAKQRPGNKGQDAVAVTREMSFCRSNGPDQGCERPLITECKSEATSGEDGMKALLGVKGALGGPGAMPGILKIKLAQPLTRGKISYISRSGRTGSPGLYSPEIKATVGGASGLRHSACKAPSSAGKAGASIQEQVASGQLSALLVEEFKDRRHPSWAPITPPVRGTVLIEVGVAELGLKVPPQTETIVEEESPRAFNPDVTLDYNMPSITGVAPLNRKSL